MLCQKKKKKKKKMMGKGEGGTPTEADKKLCSSNGSLVSNKTSLKAGYSEPDMKRALALTSADIGTNGGGGNGVGAGEGEDGAGGDRDLNKRIVEGEARKGEDVIEGAAADVDPINHHHLC